MKKKLFYYLFAVLCTATLFTSCSDDDDEVKYPIDTDLAGSYVGNLSVNVDGNQMGTTENQKITISQSNKGTNQIALSLKNSFETWKSLNDGAFEEPDGGWATSNTGVYFIKMAYSNVYNGDYPVVKSEDAKDGTVAAKLITLDTNGQAGAELWPGFVIPAIPKVTSGSLFLGTFETDIQNTLNSTKFGNPYYSKPISVHFSYKYTPGTVYYTCPDPVKAETVVEDPNTTDECSATAVIYEVPYWETVDPDDANNKDYDKRLTGANLYTNTDQVIAMATFSSGVQEDYKDVTLTLNYTKDYDPTKKYRFAIVFSSSKNGDKFSGAPGSTLIVDNVKVVAEK